jgi:hypothetical protein
MQTVHLEIDPLNAYPAGVVNPEHGGLIPSFFVTAFERLHVNEQAPSLDNVAQAMDDIYRFGGFCYPLGGSVDPDGVYTYPQDPDLYPLLKMTCEGLTLYVYEYGIVALTDGARTLTARFD